MTKKPKPPLKLVGSEGGATTTEPLRDLGMHGRKLWNDVMREYEIADAGGLEMLTQHVRRWIEPRLYTMRLIATAL